MILECYRSLVEHHSSTRARLQSSAALLAELWQDYPDDAYTFIGTRRGDAWQDHAICGDREAMVRSILTNHPTERYDIYYCLSAFRKPQRRTENALPSRYAWSDMDDTQPDAFEPQPSALWETSPGRHQGLWWWKDVVEPGVAEQRSRALWQKCGGDRGGWSITKMLRLPGTLNHKPRYDKPRVLLLSYSNRPQRIPQWLANVKASRTLLPRAGIDIGGLDAQTIMRRYRRPMGMQAGLLMMATRIMRPDRSGAVYMIVAAMVSAGATDAEIAVVLLVNPYFISKWGDDLAKAEEQIIRIRAKVEVGQ